MQPLKVNHTRRNSNSNSNSNSSSNGSGNGVSGQQEGWYGNASTAKRRTDAGASHDHRLLQRLHLLLSLLSQRLGLGSLEMWQAHRLGSQRFQCVGQHELSLQWHRIPDKTQVCHDPYFHTQPQPQPHTHSHTHSHSHTHATHLDSAKRWR